MSAYQQTTFLRERRLRRLRLRELPEHETPRGRIRAVGPTALSDAELLALLLCGRSGSLKSVELAQHLLIDLGGWAGLLRADVHRLCGQPGIGVAKAAAIKAALEIARRVLLAENQQRLQVKSPADIAQLLLLEMGHLDQEHLRTVLLDTKNYVRAPWKCA
jgi:DNA repair protein RadC